MLTKRLHRRNESTTIKKWENLNGYLDLFCETTRLCFKSILNIAKTFFAFTTIYSIFFPTELNALLQLLLEYFLKKGQ